MVSLTDFNKPFECTDVYEREKYTLEHVELSDDKELKSAFGFTNNAIDSVIAAH